MANGYNRVVLVGNLTRDPELRQLASSQAVCRLNIASNRQFKNRQTGDMVQEVCYVDIDVWGPQADSCNQYLQKGRQVLIEGRLKLDTWQDQEGHNRSKHSIVADRVVFLSSGSQEASSDSAQKQTAAAPQEEPAFEPRNEVERELMSQLDQIKTRTQQVEPARVATPAPARKAPEQSFPRAAAPSNGTASFQDTPPAFKDEPPFQDDLPF